MIWGFIAASIFYWAAVAADIVSTRAALARGAGTESNRDYVDGAGNVRYGKNLLVSLITWACGAAPALILPDPFGVVGTVWIIVRGAFRAADAVHNSRLGRV